MATRVQAPTGPTGNLKNDLGSEVVKEPGAVIIRIVAEGPSAKAAPNLEEGYAGKQHADVLAHVSPGEVGRRGFQHYGRGKTRAQRYYSGYRKMRATAPRYRHAYARVAYGIIGGINALRREFK